MNDLVREGKAISTEARGVARRLTISKRFVGFVRQRFGVSVIVAAIALATIYWAFLASDRYVSEAHVVVNRTDFSSGTTMDFASLLVGGGMGATDQLLLRDYLLSVDMLNKLDQKLHLREHYSDHAHDVLSRLWSADIEEEWFHKYYLSRVDVTLDQTDGILDIKVQAYSPEMAHAIATMLVQEGERYMNEMMHRLARDQVAFLETQVKQMGERLQQARQAVVSFQNAKGIVSPQGTMESLSAIVGRLEGELSDLKAKRQAMLGYLSKDAPDIVQLNLQIDAIEQQIKQEQGRLASPKGQALNRALEQFLQLQMEAEFAQDVYRTALVALEKGRVEATRTLKKVSVLQAPTMPQYPLEPRRLYNLAVFILATMVLAGIVQLIVIIIRDHKD